MNDPTFTKRSSFITSNKMPRHRYGRSLNWVGRRRSWLFSGALSRWGKKKKIEDRAIARKFSSPCDPH